MGWKVNLQPKLIAESLRKEAWTIGLKGEKKNSVALSISLLRVQIQSYFFKVLIAHLENIAGGST